MNTLFTFELLLVAVVIAMIVGAALYIAATNRRSRSETGRRVGTADVPFGTAPGDPAAGEEPPLRLREPRREFYKSLGLETAEDMKLRVYSVDEYRNELGGTHAGSNGGFVAALKAYRQLDDDWVEYSPRKAADVLELAPEDYEVDEEHSALLLRTLPPGLPAAARDVL